MLREHIVDNWKAKQKDQKYCLVVGGFCVISTEVLVRLTLFIFSRVL